MIAALVWGFRINWSVALEVREVAVPPPIKHIINYQPINLLPRRLDTKV